MFALKLPKLSKELVKDVLCPDFYKLQSGRQLPPFGGCLQVSKTKSG
jgi:hypothetical protein